MIDKGNAALSCCSLVDREGPNRIFGLHLPRLRRCPHPMFRSLLDFLISITIESFLLSCKITQLLLNTTSHSFIRRTITHHGEVSFV